MKRSIGNYAQYLRQKSSWLLCILASLVLAFRLGDYYLLDKDEPRYAAAAREMLSLGEFTIPQFNFEPRFEKPILFYLAEMFSFKLFGLSEFAARMPSVVAAILLLLLTYHVAKNFGAQITSSLILLSSLEFYFVARMSIIDMLLNLCFSAVILCFYQACLSPKHKHYLYYAGLAAGLGVLAKGPIAALLPALIIIVFLALQNNLINFIREYKREILISTGIMLVIALPWYITAHIKTAGEFTRVFFGEEHLARFTGTLAVHKASAWWYYLPVVAIGFMPWTVFLPRILWDIFKPLTRGQRLVIENPLITLCLVWAGIVLVFFSLAGVKLINYILPIYLPLAIITAIWLINNPKLSSSVTKIAVSTLIIYCLAVVLVLEPYASKRQANIALLASTIPEHAQVVAVDYLPPSLVYYAKRSSSIDLIQRRDFMTRMYVAEPVYFIAKRDKFHDLTELKDCCEVFKADDKFIYGKNLQKRIVTELQPQKQQETSNTVTEETLGDTPNKKLTRSNTKNRNKNIDDE